MNSPLTRTERLLLDRMSIRSALGFGMALMLVVTAALSGLTFWSEARVDRSRERLGLQTRGTDAAERGNAALQEARRYERDFLLRYNEFSVAEARSRYLSLFNLRMDDFEQAIAEMRSVDGAPGSGDDADKIRQLSHAYRAAFINVADLVGLRGGMTSGLYGTMRLKGDEIEKMLSVPGDEALLAELLRMRRAKTDYLLSGGMQYAVAFREAAQRIVAHIGGARMAMARKQALLSALGQYHGDFEEYVALSERISADIVRFREAAAAVQPILDRILEQHLQRRDALRRELQDFARKASRIMVSLEVLGLLLGAVVGLLLYRKIRAMIAKVEIFSARIGGGDFSARFATRAGGEEGSLAVALNAMADELHRSHAALADQAAQLASASRMKAELLSSVSHEVKTPLNAIVGFADLLEGGAAGPLTSRQKEYAAQINVSGKHLAQLIDRIVEVTRRDPENAPDGDGDSGLPATCDAQRGEESAAGAGARDSGQPRVLLVDDHAVNRTVLARQLAALGYECDTVEDAAQAIEKWLSAGPFGAMITDCNMPGMTGYELAQRMREFEAALSRPRMPIIAYTANIRTGEAQRCIDAGMDDYIAKPVDLDTLREKLHRWLPRPASPIAKTLPPPTPVDGSVLAEISGGDAGIEREVVAHFLKANDSDAALLADAVARADSAQLVHAAHRMVGAGRTVGAMDFANACADLETAARANDWDGVTSKLGAFHAELDRLNLHFRSMASTPSERTTT